MHDELCTVRTALSDMRDELRCHLAFSPQKLGESEHRRPAPSGKLLPPMPPGVPLHLPPELPGASWVGYICGGPALEELF